MRDIINKPLSLIGCPSRRGGARPFPKPWDGAYYARNASNAVAERGAPVAPTAGRGDYAINCGDQSGNEVNAGPDNLAGAARYNWAVAGTLGRNPNANAPVQSQYLMTGVSFLRSEVAIAHITDGTSQTYLIGEKYLNPVHYETGNDPADNETWCTGYNNDNFRNTSGRPLQDTYGLQNTLAFGGIHPGLFYMSYCDGHVEGVSLEIDPSVHKMNGNRRNAQ
jgi:prepilin-type processing-associated H-X9-DG protein